MGPYRIEDNVYVKETHRYGLSLFANKNFKKDELVFVAFGPLVKEVTRYVIPIGEGFHLDPTRPEGNLCQYICHSCEPNLGIKNSTCFVAIRDIKKDEEVHIDYAMIGYEYGDEIAETGRECRCAASSCRGTWGCYKELPEPLREKYKGYISDYLIGK